MKIEAKVKGADLSDPELEEAVNVDMDYVSADPDEIRAYVIDELYMKRKDVNEAGLEVLNMDDIVSEIVQLSSEDPV